jgi:hypothetical protein
LKATVLMAMYSIRSERAFCERLNYDLLFKWFLDMRIDQPAFDATTFSKNRQRLLEHEVADEFFAAVVRSGEAAPLHVVGALLRRRHVVEGVGVAQELQAQRRPAVGAAGGPQRRGGLARREAIERHACLDDRSRGTAVPQEQQHRRDAVLRGASVDGEPLRVDRRRRAHHRDGYAERATAVEMLARLPKSMAATHRSPRTRATTPKTSSPMSASSGSPRTSRRTPATDAPRSMARTTRHAGHVVSSGSANASRNPSAGSRPSAEDASSATSADNATGPGSR